MNSAAFSPKIGGGGLISATRSPDIHPDFVLGVIANGNDESHLGFGKEAMDGPVFAGNAVAESADNRGWILGHFLASSDLRATSALEVKWGIHPLNDMRPRWSINSVATTLAVLIRGRFVLTFPDHEVVLLREGDYVLWTAGTPHTWRAEKESVVLTVRWPSLPGDSHHLDS